jgi:Tfp pilus assembly protein PilF
MEDDDMEQSEEPESNMDMDREFSPTKLYLQALEFKKMRNFEVAEEYFKKALLGAPNDSVILLQYAVFLKDKKDHNLAEEYFLK